MSETRFMGRSSSLIAVQPERTLSDYRVLLNIKESQVHRSKVRCLPILSFSLEFSLCTEVLGLHTSRAKQLHFPIKLVQFWARGSFATYSY